MPADPLSRLIKLAGMQSESMRLLVEADRLKQGGDPAIAQPAPSSLRLIAPLWHTALFLLALGGVNRRLDRSSAGTFNAHLARSILQARPLPWQLPQPEVGQCREWMGPDNRQRDGAVHLHRLSKLRSRAARA